MRWVLRALICFLAGFLVASLPLTLVDANWVLWQFRSCQDLKISYKRDIFCVYIDELRSCQDRKIKKPIESFPWTQTHSSGGNTVFPLAIVHRISSVAELVWYAKATPLDGPPFPRTWVSVPRERGLETAASKACFDWHSARPLLCNESIVWCSGQLDLLGSGNWTSSNSTWDLPTFIGTRPVTLPSLVRTLPPTRL
jgi:hypothetical protein